MSKAFEMISESLNEIIEDLEKNDGKNLKRETLSIEEEKKDAKKFYVTKASDNYFNQAVNF
ncbi:MAG: hypothetical protein IKZ58_05200 [Selenomonadaceae bacterium]|nr:hypothetical protein [Selenomonadaceae bacterium]